MLILVTYDVNTVSPRGQKRLRQVAKECLNHGQRVQNSVFECKLDTVQYKMLKASLCEIIDMDKDSLRFYNLGKNYGNKVESFGVKMTYDSDGFLDV